MPATNVIHDLGSFLDATTQHWQNYGHESGVLLQTVQWGLLELLHLFLADICMPITHLLEAASGGRTFSSSLAFGSACISVSFNPQGSSSFFIILFIVFRFQLRDPTELYRRLYRRHIKVEVTPGSWHGRRVAIVGVIGPYLMVCRLGNYCLGYDYESSAALARVFEPHAGALYFTTYAPMALTALFVALECALFLVGVLFLYYALFRTRNRAVLLENTQYPVAT